MAALVITPKTVPQTPEELALCLDDPEWRLYSGQLYKILTKSDGEDGLSKPFVPNRAQRRFMKRLHYRNLILKARQLGFTTMLAIYFLDCCLFRPKVRAGIIAQDLQAAETIFRDKVRYAYENLPDEIRERMPLKKETTKELIWAHNNSSIRVATSMRSGTLHYLHVSEFGKIGAKHPEKAKEVVTGSIPAVAPDGVLVIESTAEGQSGKFYEIATEAKKLHDQGKKLSAKEYRFHFFPWFGAIEYRLDPDDVFISEKDHLYFDRVEILAGELIDIEQRAWYVATRNSEFGGSEELMWQEYPSTPEEAFQKSTEGCYYTKQVLAARKEGRIGKVPYLPGYPVNTFWDIGSSDGACVWMHQRVGAQDRFIDFIENWGEPYSWYVQELQSRGFVWGRHYLPHDGNHVRQGMDNNHSPQEMLGKLGLRDVVIVPRVPELQHGITAVRDAFPAYWFDADKCAKGIIHIESYKKDFNRQTQTFKDIPLKDVHTEAADALRQHAQAFQEHGVRAGDRPKRPRRRNAA